MMPIDNSIHVLIAQANIYIDPPQKTSECPYCRSDFPYKKGKIFCSKICRKLMIEERKEGAE